MHQNEWFQVWFFKNFLGRGSPSPLPRPLPPLFLGLRPRFGLRPQFSGASRPRLGLCPRQLGRFAPSIQASPSTFDWGPWFGPPKINSWIRPCSYYTYMNRVTLTLEHHVIVEHCWQWVYRIPWYQNFYPRNLNHHSSASSNDGNG